MALRYEAHDARIAMAKALFPGLPKGYYAVRSDEGEPLQFIRVSFPRFGIYKGWQKIQSQHGDQLMAGVLIDPEGHMRVLRESAIDAGMLIVADPVRAAIAYAVEIGNCCRCNATLTDERSRHYGIGPECENHWPDIIERVDEMNELQGTK